MKEVGFEPGVSVVMDDESGELMDRAEVTEVTGSLQEDQGPRRRYW